MESNVYTPELMEKIQEYLKVKDCNKVLDLVQSKIQQSV